MSIEKKIVTLPTLKRKIVQLRKQGVKIAFTNGCFDILHAGHISYLQKASRAGRVLIVGLNSDRSIRRIKGLKRPIVSEQDRAVVLSALACVDYVTLFNEDMPLKLIEALKPDILIKGADWKGRGVVGSEFVLASGGKVEYIKYVPGRSSTDIIKRIEKSVQKQR